MSDRTAAQIETSLADVLHPYASSQDVKDLIAIQKKGQLPAAADYFFMSDDFDINWEVTGTLKYTDQKVGTGTVALVAGANGLLDFACPALNDSGIRFLTTANLKTAKDFELNFRMSNKQLANVAHISVGAYTDANNWLIFDYVTATHANWYCSNRQGGTTSFKNSGVAVDITSYHVFTIKVSGAGTMVDYYIDGVNVGHNELRIPTGNLMLYMYAAATGAGGGAGMVVDYWNLRQSR